MTRTRPLLAAAVVLLVSTAAPTPHAAASSFCGVEQMQGYLNTLAASVPIRPPVVVFDTSGPGNAFYRTPSEPPMIGTKADCLSASTLAHEFGHYITDAAARFSWPQFQAISARFTPFENWLRQSDDVEGYERAAHCIGRRWVVDGPYTRCPHGDARRIADEVIIAAAEASRPAPPTRITSSLSGDGVLIEWVPSATAAVTSQKVFLDGVLVAELGPAARSFRGPAPDREVIYQVMAAGPHTSNFSSWLRVRPDGSSATEPYVAPLPPVLKPPPPPPPPTSPPSTTQPAPAAPAVTPAPTTTQAPPPPVPPMPEMPYIDLLLLPEVEVEPDVPTG